MWGITSRLCDGKLFKLRGEPVGNRWGSYGEPVGNRVGFVGNRVFRGVWHHRFLYIFGVKTPDRLFPFIKLNGEGGDPGGGGAVGPSRILPALWLGSVRRNLEFYHASGWGFSLGSGNEILRET